MSRRSSITTCFAAGLFSLSILFADGPAWGQIAGGVGGAGGAGGGVGGAGGAGGTQGQQSGTAAGIIVDAAGVVRPVFARDTTGKLDLKRKTELAAKSLPADVNTSSPLRKISLVQLEAACEEYAKKQEHVPAEMQYLAGLHRIDYVFVYPESKDLVIAGPAEGFVLDGVGRAVGIGSGRPPLRLDDLMVAFRTLERDSRIGCSIDPTESNLAQLNAFVARNSTAATPDLIMRRFDEMARILGMQNVSVFGVPADSHFAEALVEADYRMKRLSMGLEPPPISKFQSHLAMIAPGANTMQRWWFMPLYDAFVKSEDGLAFQFAGQRVQLMSQEEMVSAGGQRSASAFTRVSTQRFAKQFTDKYQQVADASPIFAELQTLFDLAVLAALCKKERLPEQIGWTKELFLDDTRATIARSNVPRQVISTVNYKSAGGRGYIGLVGGGVTINPMQAISQADFRNDSDGTLKAARNSGQTERRPEQHPWWWD